MKKKKKYISPYILMKKKYPYCFSESVMGAKFKSGLKEPEMAEDYVIEFFNITKDLLQGNYKIVDCLAQLSDDEFCSYGEMELVRNGEWITEGIEKWKDYYLNGPGRSKREVCKDLIDTCHLHMNLKHVKGRPFLKNDSYWVHDERDRRKKKHNKFALHNWSGIWTNKDPMLKNSK